MKHPQREQLALAEAEAHVSGTIAALETIGQRRKASSLPSLSLQIL